VPTKIFVARVLFCTRFREAGQNGKIDPSVNFLYRKAYSNGHASTEYNGYLSAHSPRISRQISVALYWSSSEACRQCNKNNWTHFLFGWNKFRKIQGQNLVHYFL